MTSPTDAAPTRWTRRIPVRNVEYEISVSAAEAEREGAARVLDAVADLPPTLLRDGWRFENAWGPLRLVDTPDGLEVTSPDYERLHGAWTSDLTVHLRVERQQVELLRDTGVGTEPDPPHFTDFLLTEAGVATAPTVYMERTARQKDGDSGWYVGVGDPGRERGELESHRVGDLLVLRPELVAALSVARGWLVIARDGRIASVHGPDDGQRWPLRD